MKAPTLADAVIRASFKNYFVPASYGPRIAAARRFVLDKSASSFLADLAHASFHGEAGIVYIEQTRQLARLPHKSTWIEYDPRVFRSRTLEAHKEGTYFVNSESPVATTSATIDEITPHLGWLLETHPKLDTVFEMTVFADMGNWNVLAIPISYCWSTDDTIPPWPPLPIPNPAHVATGIAFESPHVILRKSPYRKFSQDTLVGVIREQVGELRFAWSLLAAINDIPVGVKIVSGESKGAYLAKGKYRKFLEHSIISIDLPKGRDPVKLARKVVEQSRKRAHQVRGHWRRDWRHENNRIWVHEHERGDASLGFVTHDYKIHHEEEGPE